MSTLKTESSKRFQPTEFPGVDKNIADILESVKQRLD